MWVSCRSGFRTSDFASNVKRLRQQHSSLIVWSPWRTASAFDGHTGKPIVTAAGWVGTRRGCRTRPSHHPGAIPPGIALPRIPRVPAVFHRQMQICREAILPRPRIQFDMHSIPRGPKNQKMLNPKKKSEKSKIDPWRLLTTLFSTPG